MIFLVMVFLITIFARELFANISISQNPEFALNEVEEPVLSEVEEPALLKSEYLEATLRIPASEATPTPAGPKFVPFKVGERLEYSVGWGNINAGSAIMTIEDIIEYQGHEVYQVTVEANSNRFFSLFYKVRDKLESLIDVKGLFSRRYWTKQDEGNQKRERKYEFDQENNTVKYRDQTYYIRYGIQDEVSAIFYIRTLDLQVDTPVYVDIFARKQNWQVKCNILKTEEIDVPAGKFETILVEPELKFEGLMKKGKVKVWFTNDERRLPVQVNSKIVIGSITMKLERYQLGEEKVAYNK
jgi:hypothetical protein